MKRLEAGPDFQPDGGFSGEEYLKELGRRFVLYKGVLSGLSDEALEKERRALATKEIGTASFLADFAMAGEERRRNVIRWAEGRNLPRPSKEQVDAVFSALPRFTLINPEAIGAMKVSEEKKYKIDIVAEDIISEITKRLSRRVDAYYYHQDRAEEVLNIPGLGEVKVKLSESGDGIFRTVSSIETENFKIWNCRRSGVTYLNRFCDISRPSEIKIDPLNLEINLYDDDSGIFVGKDGKKFTNARWKTAVGSGYKSDYLRDDLYRTWSGPNEYSPDDEYANKDWRKDKTVLSYKKIEDEAISWMVKKVLVPLRKAPIPARQEEFIPKEEPFPKDKVGPLFTFVKMEDVEKILRVKDDPTKAYPDERKAVRTNTRLIPLDIETGKGVPKEAYDGHIWCGVGKVDKQTNLDELVIAWSGRRTDRMFGWNEAVAIIMPKTATDIYVVDWQEILDYREKAFSSGRHQALTNFEVSEMYTAMGRTMIPITKYKGGYKEPIVIMGRDLEFDEIIEIFLPPEEIRVLNNRDFPKLIN